MLGKRFKAMYSTLGFNASEVAQLLQVSERTVHNWVSGAVQIPYAAYKLLRLQLRYDLPGKAWDGWRMSAGRLYTPEGYELNPADFSWWSLLVRRAALFGTMQQELSDLRRALPQTSQNALRQAGPDASRSGLSGLPLSKPAGLTSEVPVTPHFSPENRTKPEKTQARKARSSRMHDMAARIRDRGALHG